MCVAGWLGLQRSYYDSSMVKVSCLRDLSLCVLATGLGLSSWQTHATFLCIGAGMHACAVVHAAFLAVDGFPYFVYGTYS